MNCRRTFRAALIVAVLLCSLVLTAAPARSDEYQRDPGVDVLEYVFRLRLSDDDDVIHGDASLLVAFAEAGLGRIHLDLASPSEGTGMQVLAVLEDGSPVVFRHQTDRLEITLSRPTRAGEHRRFRVRYQGVPRDGLVIGHNRYGQRTFFGDNWPDRAHQWLPLVDHVSDKAIVQFDVTAPAHYQVISNGRLLEKVDLGDELRLTRWRSNVALAPKVMVIGVAPFAVQWLAPVFGKQVQSWVYPQDRDAGFKDFARARRILEFFDDWIGPFPYAKLANVQSTTRYGGMENAGAIFYSENAVAGDSSNEALLAHEIAHQWFGDSVTEADWHHVWLSEGFATYFTQLYLEHTYGPERLRDGMRQARDRVLAFAERNPGSAVLDESITDLNRLLSPNAYQRGAWVLHMLRHRLGDAAFQRGIRNYYRSFRDGNALSQDLRRSLELAAGEDLSGFFEQWVRRAELPELSGTWRYDSASGLQLVLEQMQVGEPLFFPVQVEIITADGQRQVHTLSMAHRQGSLQIRLAAPPRSVRLDPDVWLLYRDRGLTQAQ